MKSFVLAAALASVATANPGLLDGLLGQGNSATGEVLGNDGLDASVKLPAGISISASLGPKNPPPAGRTNVWHPAHPGTDMDGCDAHDDGWHYVHPCDECSNTQTWTTSTATGTVTSTVYDCPMTVTNCPARTTHITTVTTTICPAEEHSHTATWTPEHTSTWVPAHTSTWVPEQTSTWVPEQTSTCDESSTWVAHAPSTWTTAPAAPYTTAAPAPPASIVPVHGNGNGSYTPVPIATGAGAQAQIGIFAALAAVVALL